MRIMNGQSLLGAISCVSDLHAIAEGAFSVAAGEPEFSFVLANGEGLIVLSRGEASASASTVRDLFDPVARDSVQAAMKEVRRPGGVSVKIIPSRGRPLLMAVTRTNAPDWYLFVTSDLPRVSTIRVIVLAGLTAAALAVLVASMFLIGLSRARRIDSLVRRLERERDAAAGIVHVMNAAALRLRASAATLRERAAVLAVEAAGGKTAGKEAVRLLAREEELFAELRAGTDTRMSLLIELAASARDTALKSHAARSAFEAMSHATAAAEVELSRVITTGSAVALSVENAAKGVGAIVNSAERTRLLALNAALESSRFGGHGARAADEMRRLAEETAGHAQRLAAALAAARINVRIVGRSAQEAGKAVHQAATQSAESSRALEEALWKVNAALSRLDLANTNDAGVHEEVGISDRSRSAADGVTKIMARVEALCVEIQSLAATVFTVSEQATQRSSPPTSSAPQIKAIF
jgi:methyl-accepting chemotaxis protein